MPIVAGSIEKNWLQCHLFFSQIQFPTRRYVILRAMCLHVRGLHYAYTPTCSRILYSTHCLGAAFLRALVQGRQTAVCCCRQQRKKLVVQWLGSSALLTNSNPDSPVCHLRACVCGYEDLNTLAHRCLLFSVRCLAAFFLRALAQGKQTAVCCCRQQRPN